nr:predicted protein [Triticum aestivum]
MEHADTGEAMSSSVELTPFKRPEAVESRRCWMRTGADCRRARENGLGKKMHMTCGVEMSVRVEKDPVRDGYYPGAANGSRVKIDRDQ